MKDQGKFEIAKFHGMDVAIFDSHWFANTILETGGRKFMCAIVHTNIDDSLPREQISNMDCYATMLPYRDFMAPLRKNNSNFGSFLKDIFDGCLYMETVSRFRLETARRMLAAPPIRYCIPFTVEIINTPTIQLEVWTDAH
jgi:hypothetical protein